MRKSHELLKKKSYIQPHEYITYLISTFQKYHSHSPLRTTNLKSKLITQTPKSLDPTLTKIATQTYANLTSSFVIFGHSTTPSSDETQEALLSKTWAIQTLKRKD